jgi:Na+-transporting methylmalonyl-CoA/oxaloacetate decarboxylase gamma subunit
MLVGMEIVLAVFFLLLLAASITGRTADSRDSADWKPSNDGFRPT